jgi:predicted dehydrogenase
MSRVSRRSFLRTSAAAGTLFALPAGLYRSALLAADAPSERVRLGFIGVGNQGGPKNNLKHFLKLAPTVALCDVDRKYLAEGADFIDKNQGKAPATHHDFRRLLDSKDVDAVVITTPDHWHALMTVRACEAGKDVYIEKPLSLTIREGRVMTDAARRHNRVVQTGSMQRSAKEFRTACELVRNGAIGKVTRVLVGLPGPNWVDRTKGKAVPDGPPPAVLDYDLWLGPAPERAYNANRVHYLFRFFWDYSGGQQTNFGAHHLDIAQWGLGTDDTGPTRVEGAATFDPEGRFETPETAQVTYTYATGVPVLCTLGSKPHPAEGGKGKPYPGGTTFEGDKGKVYVTRGKLEVTIDGQKADPAKLPSGPVKLEASDSHYRNFLDCVRTRKRPICDVEIGHRSATVCHLGNIAVRTGKAINWDPAKEEIVGDAAAAKWVSKEYRKPWSLS